MDSRWPFLDYYRMRAQSAFGRRTSRRDRGTERFGLENYEATPAGTTIGPALKLASFLLTCLMSGCVQNSFEIRHPAQPRQLKSPLAAEVLLDMDDSGLSWGAGKVGNALKTALVNNRAFGQVHYPIYPVTPVPIKLQVVARGGIVDDPGGGVAKSFVTGFLLFLPAGVIQYRDTFTVNAEVWVHREGRKFGPLVVESRVAAHHTLFAGPDSYNTQAGQLALEDLGARLAAALAEHPEWFSQ